MISIDGSIGEGGGQVLRTALALSLVTGQPFSITNIRAGRKKPGLLRQHLCAVNAAVAVGSARVEGADVGSKELTFTPGKIKAGEYRFSIGTAGSATLVLQTVLPALITASGPSRLTLEGGTHNPYAPPFDFLERTFLPLLNRMGPHVEAKLERHGFYPAGGGRFQVTIEPSARLSPLSLVKQEPITERRARILIANLPLNIAERECHVIAKTMNWLDELCAIETVETSAGPGNVVMIELASSVITEVITAFGERSVSAEKVAHNAVDEAREYIAAGVPVGTHLADQLLLPFALAGSGEFLTMPLSRHALTNQAIIQKFLNVPIRVEPSGERNCLVRFGNV